MKHYFSRRVRAVLIIAVLLAVVLAVVSGVTGKDIPKMLVQSVMTPLRAVSAGCRIRRSSFTAICSATKHWQRKTPL